MPLLQYTNVIISLFSLHSFDFPSNLIIVDEMRVVFKSSTLNDAVSLPFNSITNKAIYYADNLYEDEILMITFRNLNRNENRPLKLNRQIYDFKLSNMFQNKKNY